MPFKDHFSENSDGYRRYRPGYPPRLFAYLSSISRGHERAWDCATGTGQAAVNLAEYFSEVIATDASKAQIEEATSAKGIRYVVAPAEKTVIKTHSIDIVTVAQALHWFDIESFFEEARRVLKPNGILAVWSYKLAKVRPDIDEIINHLYGTVLKKYWPEERTMVEEEYGGIEFPFVEVQTPSFEMGAEWNLNQFIGYLRTWSAVEKCLKSTGIDPIVEPAEALSGLWNHPENRLHVRWPLTLKVRQKHAG